MDRKATAPRSESALDRFLFGLVPATPLAVLRIATGLLMISWSISMLNDVEPLLTWLRVSPDGEIGWWQFMPGASAGAVQAMIVLLLASSILLTVGCWTRIASWSTFFLTLFVQRYNPDAFNGGDFILESVLLLGLALGPCGAYLSVDSYRRYGRILWQASVVSAWPLRFIQLHISLGYILTVLLKLRGHTWMDGTAIWYALNLDDLIRFHLPRWITAPPVGALLTWGTLVVEMGVGVGVWIPRIRRWVLLGGVLLHLGIILTFGIGFFSYVMFVAYLAWLPPVRDIRILLPSRVRRRVGSLAEPKAAIQAGH